MEKLKAAMEAGAAVVDVREVALHMLGFDNVRTFPAGYGAWEAAGEATE